MRNLCFASKWDIFLYNNIYIQISLSNENCVFFAIFIFVCGMKYQCVKKNIFDGKKRQKGRKQVSLNVSPILKLKSQILKENP